MIAHTNRQLSDLENKMRLITADNNNTLNDLNFPLNLTRKLLQ